MSSAPSISAMRAEAWASEVRIGTCQPCQERAVTPDRLQRDREQARGDLLARGDDGVVFAGIVQRRGIAAPLDQPVGGSRHGRDHHRDLVAGIDLALDVARHVADALDVGDRGAAELHHQASHGAPPPLLIDLPRRICRSRGAKWRVYIPARGGRRNGGAPPQAREKCEEIHGPTHGGRHDPRRCHGR